MSIHHHPDPSSLMSCSAGAMPEPLAAVMATHLSLCPACRRQLERLDCLGAVMFESLPRAGDTAGVAVAPPPRAAAPIASPHRGELPAPIVELLRPTGRKLPWRRLGVGLWYLPIALSKGVDGHLNLVKVAPGVAMPEHGHSGSELTIILDGAYTDEIGTFGVGDVADLDDSVEHRPVACPKKGCICLTASEGTSRFKGWIAQLAARMAGF